MIPVKKYLPYVAGGVALLGITTGAYFLGKGQASADKETMAELEELRENESEATIVKRVSQQMEEIAYQQKEISDRQRERAEEQSQLATQMRLQAEKESKAARAAENRALASAKEASEQRLIAVENQKMAEEQRDEANYARSISDTLSYRALGRTLGYSSSVQYDNGNYDVAGLLAYASWHFLDKYNGNTYQSESFKALSTCSASVRTYKTDKSGGVNAICRNTQGDDVVVSDYGEIEVHGNGGQERKILMQNSEYNFKDAYVYDETIFALSLHGPLILTGTPGKDKVVELPEDSYFRLVPREKNKLFAVGRKSVMLFDINKGVLTDTGISVESSFSAATDIDEGLLLFCEDGSVLLLSDDNTVSQLAPKTGKTVTAACYDCKSKRLFLGQKNGDITLVEGDMAVTTLYGHISQITDIAVKDGIMISSSYDKSILFWNLSKIQTADGQYLYDASGRTTSLSESISPVEYTFGNCWPMCIYSADNDDNILVGLSDGQVVTMNTSVEKMAAQILAKTPRDLTDEEWDNYVGNTIPKENFK